MSFLAGLAVVSVLTLAVSLSSAYVRRLPLTTAGLYLGTGALIGPAGLGWLELDLALDASWLERLTEVAVIVSLFVGGLTLRLPLRDPAWRAAYLLAGPVMVLSIAAVALVGVLAFGMPWGLALLLGAVLAPTDPVLASAMTVTDARDEDRMRYGLSGEAGFNDGMAFPFVAFAMLWITHEGPGDWVLGWVLHRLVWAVPAGLAVGFGAGWLLGRLAVRIRHTEENGAAPSDFLAIGLVALSYVGAEVIGAWGFLAAFAAGLGLRHAERTLQRAHGRQESEPAEHRVPAMVDDEDVRDPVAAAGVTISEALAFGHTLERMFEALIVLLIGAALATHWEWRGVLLALPLLLVIRPAAAWLCLSAAPVSRAQRGLMAWFGIRGIGSLYYLTYAITHGTPGAAADVATNLTLVVVACSIVLHGLTGQPLLWWYEGRLQHAYGATGSARRK